MARRWIVAAGVCAAVAAMLSQRGGGAAAQGQRGQAQPAPDPIRTMVSRLELAKYKATIKDLTQFGDRRQGTKRNRDAIDWIEAQLRSYGCANTERITYQYQPQNQLPNANAGRAGSGAQGAGPSGQTGSAGAPGARQAGGQGRGRGIALGTLAEPVRGREGGSTFYGSRGRTGVFNADPDNRGSLDPRLYELNKEPTSPGERQQVYCTTIGTTRPDEMYIVAAHMDGLGWGEAANDDGSGTALVMELARVLNMPDVTTERSIRFVLWNNEETGYQGAVAYVQQRSALQGKEEPSGSGKYPEPRWLGMIQHDMMLWDHGMPRADGTVSPEQRREADVNVEFQSSSKVADPSMTLAFAFKAAADRYSTDYPATVGPHMTSTDSTPFMDLVPAISVRENERGAQTGSGWNPTWHQPTDVYATFSDKDFTLGLNAAQITLSAIAGLTGATLK